MLSVSVHGRKPYLLCIHGSLLNVNISMHGRNHVMIQAILMKLFLVHSMAVGLNS